MPKGHPLNPELTRQRQSDSQKNRVWSNEHRKNVREMLIKRNKSKVHIKKVKKALTGHRFTQETLQKMRDNHADTNGNKNPNWRGDNIGRIGVHVWLRKFFIKTRICEHCRLIKEGLKGTDWALINGKKYERKRENFKELCRKCHTNYDRNKEFCINGHKMIEKNLYKTKTGKRLCKLCNKIYRTKGKI